MEDDISGVFSRGGDVGHRFLPSEHVILLLAHEGNV